ncbi:MAG: hypothetical protein RLZZ568_1753 [Cyanobacteriota bacterium]
MWRTVCQSAIGSFHVETGLPCQDYGAYQPLGKDILIGAVADGAGSAKHSDLGAKVAVETAIQFIIDRVDEQNAGHQALAENGSEETLSAIFERFFPLLLTKVDKGLHAVAQKSNVEFPDLATTLLVFIATSQWLAAMQIGDGFILVKPVGGAYQLLFRPDKGEYINETTFVTSANALADMQIRVLAEPLEFVCAATDGVEKVAINYATWQPFPPFFQPLEQYLQQSDNPLDEDLKEFLERKELNDRTTDDKTLLLAVWTQD